MSAEVKKIYVLDESNRLEVSIDYFRGEYYLYISREKLEQRNGYTCVVSYLFEDNVSLRLNKVSRKSKKGLEEAKKLALTNFNYALGKLNEKQKTPIHFKHELNFD